jgi:hypothetical protein
MHASSAIHGRQKRETFKKWDLIARLTPVKDPEHKAQERRALEQGGSACGEGRSWRAQRSANDRKIQSSAFISFLWPFVNDFVDISPFLTIFSSTVDIS